MIRLHSSLLSVAFFLLVASCGGRAEDASGDGDGDSSGDGDTPIGDGGSFGDGDDDCTPFEDDPGAQLEVYIRNDRTTPLFLGPREYTCDSGPLFSLSDSTGQQLATQLSCSSTCQDYMTGDLIGCPDFCAASEAIEVAPGDAHLVHWDALTVAFLDMPAACNAVASEGTYCPRHVAVRPGRFTFSATAGTEALCETAEPDECLGATLVGGEVLSASVTVDLDASYGIYEEGAGGPDAGPLVPIEISFTD